MLSVMLQHTLYIFFSKAGLWICMQFSIHDLWTNVLAQLNYVCVDRPWSTDAVYNFSCRSAQLQRCHLSVFHKIKNGVKSIMTGVMGLCGKFVPCEANVRVRYMVFQKPLCGQLTSYCMAGCGVQPSAIMQSCMFSCFTMYKLFALHCKNCGYRKIIITITKGSFTAQTPNQLWSETQLIG